MSRRTVTSIRVGGFGLVAFLVFAFHGVQAADAGSANTKVTAFSVQPRLGTAQPLDPHELLEVRSLGAAVLQARAYEVKDPDEEALHGELSALAKAVSQVLPLHPGSISPLGAGGAAHPASVAPAAMSEAGMQAIHAQLTAVHGARSRLQQPPPHQVSPFVLAHRTALASQVTALELETQQALDAPAGAARYEKLRALRERLQPRSLAEQIRQPTGDLSGQAVDVAPTPTLTTLIKHR